MPALLLRNCWNRLVGLGMVAYLAATNLRSLGSIGSSSHGGASSLSYDGGSAAAVYDNGIHYHQQQPSKQWTSSQQNNAIQQEWVLSSASRNDLKIILLWDGSSLDLLQHVVRNLHACQYGGNKIDLEVQMAAGNKDLVKDKDRRLETFRTSVEWNHGDVRMVLLKEEAEQDESSSNQPSLRDHVLQIWNPSSSRNEKVMIFHVNNRSNRHPHAQWYAWFTDMVASQLLHSDDIAGIGLSTERLYNQLLSKSDGHLITSTTNAANAAPFLFPDVDWSSGFAPFPDKWQEFSDYVDCVQQYLMGEDGDENGKSFSYNDIETWWGNFTAAKHNSYHLYQFLPNGEPMFGQDDWIGSNAQSRQLRSNAASLTVSSTNNLDSLTKYNYRNNNKTDLVQLPTKPRLRTAVMSAAVGYPIETFQQFVHSLRQHYHGDVWLAVNATVTDEIAEYLQQQRIHTVAAPEITGSDGEAKARDRFTFFETICKKDRYDLCLHTDFRDSIFQADPFGEFYENEEIVQNVNIDQQHLYIYEHEMIMNPWHFKKMAACGIYDAYGSKVAGKWILNSGSVIATPLVWKELGYYNRLWDRCNDQVVYNAWVYTAYEDILEEHKYNEHVPNVTMHFHRQGEGAMNIVGFAKGEGGFVHQNSQGEFLGRNCLASPVVHQFDRVGDPHRRKGTQ